MFHVNPEHPGMYDAVGVPQFHRVKWKFHTHGLVISSPAVDAQTAYVGSTDRNLYAVDLASGAQKWKFAIEARITSSPAVVQRVVYFGS
jgi:outer membrane protein assembly factor BamB